MKKTGNPKSVGGDYVGGDKIGGSKITVGNVTGSNFAVGENIEQNINSGNEASIDEIVKAFTKIRKAVSKLPEGENKTEATQAVDKLEAEAKKGDKADESRVSRWLSFLADTAPDAWEVALATFTNPVRGLSVAFKKIAEKAQAAKPKTESI